MHKVSRCLNSLFCPANSLKPKVYLFTIINNKEKQQIITFDNTGPENMTCKMDIDKI